MPARGRVRAEFHPSFYWTCGPWTHVRGREERTWEKAQAGMWAPREHTTSFVGTADMQRWSIGQTAKRHGAQNGGTRTTSTRDGRPGGASGRVAIGSVGPKTTVVGIP